MPRKDQVEKNDIESSGESESAPVVERPLLKNNPKISVKIVTQNGKNALVEYMAGHLRRCTIPLGAIMEDGTVYMDDLAAGIPFGVAWESIIKFSADPVAFGAAMRNNGIWTAEDLRKNPRAVIGILQAIYGADLAALIQAIEKL